MPEICYVPRRFTDESLRLIAHANAICEEYRQAGYDLTLRQLYYQFVARGLIPNTDRSYKNLGSVVNDARLAGELDWDYLIDRTRNPVSRPQWDHPRDILKTAAQQFHIDWWATQPVHVEVWVEKEALAGVVQRVARQYSVTSLACRGYMSQSEQWVAARRFEKLIEAGKRVVVLHLGDHDPSGIDMSRDNATRLSNFIIHDLANEYGFWPDQFDTLPNQMLEVAYQMKLPTDAQGDDLPAFELRRIALNMDQVEQYAPPPNPAKMSDSRSSDYVAEFGHQSWELDALPPDVLNRLIADELGYLIDFDAFEQSQADEEEYRTRIRRLIDEHGDILELTSP